MSLLARAWQRPAPRAALTLAAVTACALLLLGITHRLTRAPIETAQSEYRNRLMTAVLPGLEGTLMHNAPALVRNEDIVINQVLDANGQQALLIETTTADGYNGEIELLMGVLHDGRLDGVRVLRHRETPGLGDPIERERSDWIEQFRGAALDEPAAAHWTSHGPKAGFDAITGATISSEAVTRAVHKALILLDTSRENTVQ